MFGLATLALGVALVILSVVARDPLVSLKLRNPTDVLQQQLTGKWQLVEIAADQEEQHYQTQLATKLGTLDFYSDSTYFPFALPADSVGMLAYRGIYSLPNARDVAFTPGQQNNGDG